VPTPSPAVTLLFIVIVFGMLGLVLWGAARAGRRGGLRVAQGVRGAGVALLGWLALTGALAHHGFFDDFMRMLLAIVVPLATLFTLAFSRRLAPLLAALPPAWPVAA
jgi:hypothetical protein